MEELPGIDIIIKHTKRNGYSIKIIDNNTVELNISKYYNEEDIEDILSKHKRFIKNALEREFVKNNKLDIIHILGIEYKLELIESNKNLLSIDENQKIARVYYKDKNKIKNIIYNHYLEILEKTVNKYDSKLKEAFRIDYNVSYSFKDVKTYFGQCQFKKHHIVLSLKLAKYEEIYIISVLCHEYAHFFVQNHSDKFYEVVEKVFNNYKECQRDLRKIKYRDLY